MRDVNHGFSFFGNQSIAGFVPLAVALLVYFLYYAILEVLLSLSVK